MKKIRFSLKATLGMKILIGVALVSNCFMGLLLYNNHQADITASHLVEQSTALRTNMAAHLRETIVSLQNDFSKLPDFFESDPKQEIIKHITDQHPVVDKWTLEGRKNYSPLFKRTQKRDLAKNKIVVTVHEGRLLLTYGLFDDQGEFLTTVEQLHLQSSAVEQDLPRLDQYIRTAYADQDQSANLESKLIALKQLVADKGMAAEKTRNEILNHVDHIQAMDKQLETRKKRQQRMNLAIAGIVIFGNMIVLFFLTRIVVERPLRKLTSVIADLGQGHFPEIPMQNRKDQIGILSKAIVAFREALLQLHEKDARHKDEQLIINNLVHSMTASINNLDDRARKMTEVSLSLEALAETTNHQTEEATGIADNTALHTKEVAQVSELLSNTTQDINQQMKSQVQVTHHIVKGIGSAHVQLDDLKNAVTEIDSIINTVYRITDQTKILALNATIEAVKAGERGKGFGVVAHEVKSLSLETAQSATEIMSKVEAINGYCQTFINFFETMNAHADKLHHVTNSIENTTLDQREHINTIATLISQASENTRQVSSNVQQVNSATKKILQLSEEAHASSDHLSTTLASLLGETTEKLASFRQTIEKPDQHPQVV